MKMTIAWRTSIVTAALLAVSFIFHPSMIYGALGDHNDDSLCVSAGLDFTVVVDADGTVYSWGNNVPADIGGPAPGARKGGWDR